ncbi:PAS domain-containing hybrid sensor histidine kinase/response regulator [Nakamurella deserti]|uniref:PAS domain-containing hybrid sensor histidine kinase/response regulator n=1 Tax=Nakamurella deserti TaxID=2164074 RepID=UPI001478FE3B|nr:PAS domain-containing hybrid sensor histidine kinase/response regulator [Nakamurella deserti]
MTADATSGADGAVADPAFELLPRGTALEARLLREFADHAAIGFSLYEVPVAPGEPGRFSFVNRTYLKLLGLPSELAIAEVGDAVLEAVHPDDRHRTAQMAADFLAGRPTHQTLRMIRPDGSVRWVRSRRTPILDDDGGLVRVAGTVEDITEFVMTSTALRENEERFHQLADNVPVGFTLTDVGDPPRIVYWNPAFLQILGVDPDAADEPVERLLVSRTHPDDVAAWSRSLDDIRAGRPFDGEIRIIRPDGELRWLRIRRHPVRDEHGVVFRAAGTDEDITDRKSAEAALRFAQSEADRANAAKNEFLSRMSHELRTPLNAVLGFAQLLEMDQLSESQADSVGYIVRGGRHLLALINDVLDIASIEADRLELSIEPVHVGTALNDAVRLVQPQARDAGVALSFDPMTPAASLFVQADQRRLRQVLINLLTNAVKYNHRGGRVEVSAEQVGTGQIRFVVSDSGMGIRDEDMARLFVPFDRMGQQASGIEGAGIGLALSQRLVSFMGGHFDAHSVHGTGSVFGVTLPRSEHVDHPVVAPSATAEAVGPPERVCTLLYIEDNHSNVRLLQRILARRPGWELVHTDRGRRGLELVGACDPALIMLDLHLPDMNGIDVLRELRRQPGGETRPLVIASADASPGQVSRLIAAGVDAYITKPLDVRDVLSLLDRFAADPQTVAPPRAVT